MSKEFDFEINLAKFDKALEFQAINEQSDIPLPSSNQPDLVKSAPSSSSSANLRFDENVLDGPAPVRLPLLDDPNSLPYFCTNDGMFVPAVTNAHRDNILQAAVCRGFVVERQNELMARAACDLAIHMSGGAHRLLPKNSHQVPLIVVLCGPARRCGAFGMATARHIASHGVKTIVLSPPSSGFLSKQCIYAKKISNNEENLYVATDNPIVFKAADLPSSDTCVDLVIYCLEDHVSWREDRETDWHQATVQWLAKQNQSRKIPIMALDPPAVEPVFPFKAIVCPELPLTYPPVVTDAGRLFIANLTIPKSMFTKQNLRGYTGLSFGSKSILQLYPPSHD